MLGIFGWGFLMYVVTMMASHLNVSDLFFVFFPIVVFIFYGVIAIRPCRSFTALLVGALLHLPLLFVIVAWFRNAQESPLVAASLVPGAVVWGVYVRQLARRDDAA
jgi:hypothetical protein